MAIDDTDVSVTEFVEHAKCLTEDDLRLLQHPVPLTRLQKEWKVVHNNCGHLPFAQMDKLVQHKILPQKFAKLRGKPILCPSCLFWPYASTSLESQGR